MAPVRQFLGQFLAPNSAKIGQYIGFIIVHKLIGGMFVGL